MCMCTVGVMGALECPGANWGERSQVKVNFVCIYLCMYVYILCHGPARY